MYVEISISREILKSPASEKMEVFRIRPAEDFEFVVAPRRGLGIPWAYQLHGAKRVPLLWSSGTALIDPVLFDSAGKGPARSFFGGLFTCGPENVGPASEGYPPHGSFSRTPAGDVEIIANSGGLVGIRGVVKILYPLTGPKFRIVREIVSAPGAHWFEIRDQITPMGFVHSYLMWKYHPCFPVHASSRFISSERAVYTNPGTDWHQENEGNRYRRFTDIHRAVPEEVFTLEVEASKKGEVVAGLIDADRETGTFVRYRNDQCRILNLWKHAQEGVCGIEPGNCNVLGLTWEREHGMLTSLEPGESRKFWIKVYFAGSKGETEGLTKEIEDVRASMRGEVKYGTLAQID